MLQSLASYTAALVLNPAPGSRVLDMCAAPGGKTTALAQIMGDSGQVVALDRSHSKARLCLPARMDAHTRMCWRLFLDRHI